jgi:oligoribonuclease
MTGLVPGKDKIIEVACIITDKDLIPFHEGYEKIVSCSAEMMSGMDEWCTEHHGNVTPTPRLSLLVPVLMRVVCG